MKKLVLAAAIAAVAGNAMAAEVYSADDASLNVFGEIRAKLGKTHNDDDSTFSMSSSKLGVKGGYKLSDDITAKGYIRYKYNGNSGSKDNFQSDKTWVGVESAKFGEVRIGRMGTIHDDEMFITDHTRNFGGNAVNGVEALGTGVQSSLLSYTYGMDNGLTLKAQYQIAAVKDAALYGLVDANGKSTGEVTATIDSGYSLGAIWVSDIGLTLTGVYTATEMKDIGGSDAVAAVAAQTLTDSGGDTVTIPGSAAVPAVASYNADGSTLGLGASYSIQGWTIAAMGTAVEVQADDKTTLDLEVDGFGTSLKYAFDNGVEVYGVYDLREINWKADKVEQDVKSFTLGAEYKVHKNVLTYINVAKIDSDYKTNTATTPKDTSDKKWEIGTRWYF